MLGHGGSRCRHRLFEAGYASTLARSVLCPLLFRRVPPAVVVSTDQARSRLAIREASTPRFAFRFSAFDSANYRSRICPTMLGAFDTMQGQGGSEPSAYRSVARVPEAKQRVQGGASVMGEN
jgi:hypothetical protein